MALHNHAARTAPMPQLADRSGPLSGEGRPEPNRRRYPRILARVHCRPAGVEFFAQPLMPIDISLGGMRIRGNEQYRVGALLAIDLFFPRIAPATFTTVITWIEALRETGQRRFNIGLSFVDLNPAAMTFLTSVLTFGGESGSTRPEVQECPGADRRDLSQHRYRDRRRSCSGY
jgi:hypothetical protein